MAERMKIIVNSAERSKHTPLVGDTDPWAHVHYIGIGEKRIFNRYQKNREWGKFSQNQSNQIPPWVSNHFTAAEGKQDRKKN